LTAYLDNAALFNNAAQSFNHDFYWKCMRPEGGGEPSGRLMELITSSFGSFDNFRKAFVDAGNTAFGSGWAWLVWNTSTKSLEVMKTIGAGCPLTDAGLTPVLTMDVWEHAYYLNYKNMRMTYVDIFMDKLVNWEFVASQLPGGV
jgi:superoxide dismutase, Fe-Mn family